MAEDLWTAQLRIADGEAQEDAPEIAFAERLDHRGRSTRLYMLAEPLRPGAAQFVAEFVSRVGEDFIEAEGSLTGAVQRVLRARHEELQEWNRNSLPRDQATYGISCLIVRRDAAYLAQAGPALAAACGDDGVIVCDQTQGPEVTPIGGAAPLNIVFRELPLGPQGWYLLAGSAAAAALNEDMLRRLRVAEPDDVLPAIYPLLRGATDVAALTVGAPQPPAVEEEPPAPVFDAGDEGEPLAPTPSIAEAPLPGFEHGDALAEEDAPEDDDASPVEADDDLRPPASLEAGEHPLPPFLAAAPEVALGAQQGPTEDEAVPDDALADGAATPSPAAPEATAPDEGPHPTAAPGAPAAEPADLPRQPAFPTLARATSWQEPVDDPPPPPSFLAPPPPRSTPQPAAEWADPAWADDPLPTNLDDEDRIPLRDALGSAMRQTGVALRVAGGGMGRALGKIGAGAGQLLRYRHEPDPWDLAEQDDEDDDDFLPPASAGRGAAGGPPGGVARAVDDAEDAGQGTRLARLDPSTVGWPSNPFSASAAPILRTAVDADIARRLRPIVGLGGAFPNLRRRRSERIDERDEAATGGPSLRPALLALAAMGLILAVVAGVILIPEALRTSERGQFDELLGDARLGLSSAALATDPEVARELLAGSRQAVQDALDLRPLDPAAAALEAEVNAALEQVNLILRPQPLTAFSDFGLAGSQLALGAIQIGREALYVLDDAGARVFAAPPGGAAAQPVFAQGESYPLRYDPGRITAGAPISIRWRNGPTGPELLILDASRRLFSYTANGGVEAIVLPGADMLGSANAVAADANAVYILDATGGSIWRYAQASDGRLSSGRTVVERTDLRGSLDLVVLSGTPRVIFVASEDGRIRRFTDGAESGFALPRLDRPLLLPASLGVADNGLLFAADRGNNRVLVMTAGGTLVAQFRAEELRGLRGVAIDNLAGAIYYALPDRMLTSPLPELPDR